MSTKLEKLESTSKIFFSITSGIGVLIFGLNSAFNENADAVHSKTMRPFEISRECDAVQKKLEKDIKNSMISNQVKTREYFQTNYEKEISKTCNKTSLAAFKTVNDAINIVEVEQEIKSKTRKGFVVLGKVTPEKYSTLTLII